MKKKKITNLLKEALLKKALGYISTETIEEYCNTDDGMVLQKKKVTSKDIPPDIASFKALSELDSELKDDIQSMTDEELEKEKQRILKLLKKEST